MSGAQQSQNEASGLIPPGMQIFGFDGFTGLNTNASRVGIKDTETYICDGFFPVGESWARTLYGVGPAIFNATTSLTSPVVLFQFANIGATPYCIVFPSDGSVWAVNTATTTAQQIAPAGTITTPSVATVGVSQWNGTTPLVVIVAKQTNGYFLWDGTSFSQAGTISPLVDITSGGSGYVAPTITATGGSGSGATFTATLTAGAITAIQVTNPGTGYLVTDTGPLTLTITDSAGTAAAATVELMPFAIGGTAVTPYSGRIWIINGINLIWTAPGDPTDFSTANGGGATPSNDSTLRVGYTGIVSTNGFLYLIGDSNVSYISGVSTTTSGSTVTTSFNLQNADPQTGTPYAGTVTLLGQDVLFANGFGIHASYGGRVTKVSDPLDGFYATVPNFGNLAPSAAIATIFGKRVWMALVQVLDQVSGQPVNKLCMWDRKKWWTSQQDITLIFVASQEINSILTAYGSDGNVIVPLFAVPSVGFTKTMQSKLWAKPHYCIGKVVSRIWGLFQYYSGLSPELTISIDSENTPYSLNVTPVPQNNVTWTNNAGTVVSWTNSTSGVTPWLVLGVGIGVLGPTAVGQQGVLIGMTLSTEAADMAVLSMAGGSENNQYRG